MASDIIPADYASWLEDIKARVVSSRGRAALATNAELIGLYYRIGTEILERQTTHGWGTKVIERIALDLKAAFPDMKGFSTRNVKYMRYFAEHCPQGQFGQQPAAQLP
jgi:predicted nuclease of restriction endonuclease-like (RecB) superfamily